MAANAVDSASAIGNPRRRLDAPEFRQQHSAPRSGGRNTSGVSSVERHKVCSGAYLSQSPGNVLGNEDRRDGERDRKQYLFDNGHAENGSRPLESSHSRWAGRHARVRFAPDCVAKLFCPSGRVRLIQDQASILNLDSGIHSLRFGCYIVLLYSLSAMTFATQSPRKPTSHCIAAR